MGGRINRSLVTFIANLRDLDEDEAIRRLCKIKSIKKKWAINIYDIIISNNIMERKFAKADWIFSREVLTYGEIFLKIIWREKM